MFMSMSVSIAQVCRTRTPLAIWIANSVLDICRNQTRDLSIYYNYDY